MKNLPDLGVSVDFGNILSNFQFVTEMFTQINSSFDCTLMGKLNLT